MKRNALLGAFLSLMVAAPAVAAPPPPPNEGGGAASGSSQAPTGASFGGSSQGGGTGVGGVYGFPPGAEYDPSTSAEPGFVTGGPSRASDQVYGPAGASEEGEGGYNIIGSGLGQVEAGYGGTMPDYHVVEKGDTLWGICDQYYRDPYLWPKIWSYNEQITNAHWIFPGDRIRLTDPNETSLPNEGLKGPSLSYTGEQKREELEKQTYVLDRWAYISEEEYEESMSIVGGAQAKVMMSVLDTAYVGFQPENPPIAGERLAVYRPIVDVYDIELKGKKKNRKKKGDRIGYVVEIVGEVYISEVAKKSAEAQVVDSVRPIERKMRVGELQTRFSRIEPTPAEASDVGRIVYITRVHDLAGEKPWVVVNMGAEWGVKRGNLLDVVHKGDEYDPSHTFITPYEEGHPRRVLGQVLVVQVQEKSALGFIVDGKKEFVVGDPVEMRAPQMDRNDADGGFEAPKNDGPSGNASGDASMKTGDGKAKGEAGFQLGGGG